MRALEQRLKNLEVNVTNLLVRERKLSYRSAIQDNIIDQLFALCQEKGFDARALQVMDQLVRFDIEMRRADEHVQS